MSEKEVTVVAAVPGDGWIGQAYDPSGKLTAESEIVTWVVLSNGEVRAVFASAFDHSDEHGSFRIVKTADTKPPTRTRRKTPTTEQ